MLSSDALLWSNVGQSRQTFCGLCCTKVQKDPALTVLWLWRRTTEWTSSCGSAGTTPGWSFRQTSSPILWPSTQRCSNVCGNRTCSSPTRRAPTSTMSLRRIFSCSYSGMEMFSLVWGSRLVSFRFFLAHPCVKFQGRYCSNGKIRPLFFPGRIYSHIFRSSYLLFEPLFHVKLKVSFSVFLTL